MLSYGLFSIITITMCWMWARNSERNPGDEPPDPASAGPDHHPAEDRTKRATAAMPKKDLGIGRASGGAYETFRGAVNRKGLAISRSGDPGRAVHPPGSR